MQVVLQMKHLSLKKRWYRLKVIHLISDRFGTRTQTFLIWTFPTMIVSCLALHLWFSDFSAHQNPD